MNVGWHLQKNVAQPFEEKKNSPNILVNEMYLFSTAVEVIGDVKAIHSNSAGKKSISTVINNDGVARVCQFELNFMGNIRTLIA